MIIMAVTKLHIDDLLREAEVHRARRAAVTPVSEALARRSRGAGWAVDERPRPASTGGRRFLRPGPPARRWALRLGFRGV